MINFFRPLDYDIPKERYHFCVSSSSACPCVHARLWIDSPLKFATILSLLLELNVFKIKKRYDFYLKNKV